MEVRFSLKKIGKNPKAKKSLCKNPEYKDALAIVEGRFGEPVKRAGRFINCNYPPDDVSQEELEGYWGKPDANDPSIRERVKKATIRN